MNYLKFLFCCLSIMATTYFQNGLLATTRWWDWYFPNGKVDKGIADTKFLWSKYGLPQDLTGKRFYDLGCFDGGTCFEAASRGAVEVYGLDSYIWEIEPEVYKNFCYARDIIAPQVKDAFVEIEPVPLNRWGSDSKTLNNKHTIESFAKEYGTADVVLAAGIVYHLVDPIKFLIDLKLLVTPNTGRVYITTWCTREHKAVANFIPGWRGDNTNYWIFSQNCMTNLLNQLGYQIEAIHEAISHNQEPLISFVCSVPKI